MRLAQSHGHGTRGARTAVARLGRWCRGGGCWRGGSGLGATLAVPAALHRGWHASGATGATAHAQHGGMAGQAGPLAESGEGALLVEPEVRQAVGGELQTTLTVGYRYLDVGGQRLYLPDL